MPKGGGLWLSGNLFTGATPTELDHTIIAGNRDLWDSSTNPNDLNSPDIHIQSATPSSSPPPVIQHISAPYSLLGVVTGGDDGFQVPHMFLGQVNGADAIVIGTGTPGLVPLANNGGPTETHALLLNSLALDAGDPTFDKNDPDGNPLTDDALLYDQRGIGYDRVADGDGDLDPIIDIGAFESNLGLSNPGAPQVINVVISGSASTHDAYDFDQVITDSRGNATPRTGVQIQTVPVGGADTIAIEFSEGVTVTAEDLLLVGMRTGRIPALVAGGFNYDVTAHTATWQYSDLEANDMYVISLADGPTLTASNLVGVHDSAGNALDGEWTNPASRFTANLAVSTFPSGDGTAGGDFKFVFTLLGGDADLDGVVGESDAITHLMSMYVYQMTTGGTFMDADFDGDGDVDADDEQLVLEAIWGDNNLQDLLLTADLNGDGVADYGDGDLLYLLNGYLLGEDESLVDSGLFSSLDANDTIDQSDIDHFFAILDSQLELMFVA